MWPILIVALACLVSYIVAWLTAPEVRTPEDVAALLERSASGTAKKSEWDGFLSAAVVEPELEEIRRKLVEKPALPPDEATAAWMRETAASLRSRDRAHA